MSVINRASPRLRRSSASLRTLIATAAILLTATGCAASGGAAASAAASARGEIVTNEFEAARAVAEHNRLLAGVGPLQSDSIGQASYWDAERTADGYALRYSIGWGDCMAGCINEHEFTYEVSRTGVVRLVGERGDVIPAEVLEDLGEGPGPGARQGVAGRVVAGPVCPVEQPGDPACAPRPVPGAVLVIRGPDGTEVARATTDESGLFVVDLAAGEYLLEPQPVDGLMGTAQPLRLIVEEGLATEIEVEYDTGIR